MQITDAGGMSEGWSDALAEWTEQKSGMMTDYVLGDYVTNNANGIQTALLDKPVSLFICFGERVLMFLIRTTNPLKDSSVKALTEVHSAFDPSTSLR